MQIRELIHGMKTFICQKAVTVMRSAKYFRA